MMTEDVSSHHLFAGSELRELKSSSSIGEKTVDMAHTDSISHTPLQGLCCEGGKANKRKESGQKMEDADNSLKHICKICKKKFGCGRALGGHMRIHGPMASDLNAKKRRKVSEIGGAAIQGSEFNRASMSGSSIDCNNSEIEEPVMQQKPRKAMKGPRSRRPRYAMESHPLHPYFNSEESFSVSLSLSMSKEDEDVANWLVMLSTAEGSWRPVKMDPTEQIVSGSDESKEWKCEDNDVEGLNRNVFECRTCKKVFGSHQALGGHRARHNKVKGGCCVEQNESLEVETEVKHKFRDSSSWMDNEDADDDGDEEVTDDSLHVSKKAAAAAAAAAKVHECPICHRIFGSGQALGGHKRCHWGSSSKDKDSHTSSPTSCSPKHRQIVQQKKLLKEEGPVLRELLDLNLPAPVENDEIDSAQMGDRDEKPCNLLKSSSDSTNISYYTQQWWINNQYPLFPLALSYDVKDIHRPWLQVSTKTT